MNSTITIITSISLVLVGVFQCLVLFYQKRQSQILLLEEFRKHLYSKKNDLGILVYLGRSIDEYYQILEAIEIGKIRQKQLKYRIDSPTIWALDSAKSFFSYFSDVSLKVLQGQLNIQDVYPLFGTELLRHSRPLKILLDNTHVRENYHHVEGKLSYTHLAIRKEVQDWLTYHEGVKRRCLILLDLLWSEAARLEDLPPSDLIAAADVKKNYTSGKRNRKRLYNECKRIGREMIPIRPLLLSYYMCHSEYQKLPFLRGLKKTDLKSKEKQWTKILLNES